jgi:outer membrane murein-binding lipoprotein Lpp
MMWCTRGLVVIGLCLGTLSLTSGCSQKKPHLADPNQQANAKVNALNRLADEMAKDPQGAEARAALEDFRNTPLDLKTNAEQGEKIAEIYRQRIQGKYRGFVADELRGEVAPYLRLKQGK